ncbi:MAG: hypothetical protein AAF500_21700 [Myxococcota bacterium]
MNDVDIFIAGTMVTMIAFAGAYINVRRRANEDPVDSYVPRTESPNTDSAVQARQVHANR